MIYISHLKGFADTTCKALFYLMAFKYKTQRGAYMGAARQKGTHKKEDWLELKELFNDLCVRCFGESGYYHTERDHIKPVHAGGSDSITNLQPLCPKCNSSKGSESIDFRPSAAKRIGILLPSKFLP